MIIKEVECKKAISKSGIYGIDYSINPYLGCLHGCKYCFARYMKKFSSCSADWGEFVEVKINLIELIKKEIMKIKKGSILISSVTDPYQETEKKYMLTRKILETFSDFNKFHINILTKSSLVERDFDIIKKIKNITLGLTIVTLDEEIRKVFEPNASPIKERIDILKKAKEFGIETYAMVAPILPFITEKSLNEMLNFFKKINIDFILIDKLNIKAGNWKYIKESLMKIDSNLVKKYSQILFNDLEKNYFSEIKKRIEKECEKINLTYYFCY